MTKKINLELEGTDGNAFAVLGNFARQAKKEGWTQEEIKAVQKEAMKGDYNHLIATILDYCN